MPISRQPAGGEASTNTPLYIQFSLSHIHSSFMSTTPIQRTSVQVRSVGDNCRRSATVPSDSSHLPPNVLLSLISRTTFPLALPQLYRDCLRLVRHVAPGTDSPKARALRQTVRHEFRRNADVTDADQITTLKANAVRALSNYLLQASAPRDAHLKQSAQDFQRRSVSQAQQEKQQQQQQKKEATSAEQTSAPQSSSSS